MITSYRIAEHIANKGYFGEIVIDVTLEQHKNGIHIHIPEPNKEWESAITFGASYYLQQCVTIKGLTLKVISLHTNPVDTSQIIPIKH